MIDDATVVTTEGLEALVSALSRVGSDGESDQVRVDQLAVLERVKSAVAAAQVRVTAAFVDSQEQVAQAWSQRARECSDAGDFDGWRAAREQARAASFDDDDAESSDSGQRSGPRRRRRPSGLTGVAAQVALARHESPFRGAGHVRLALALTREMPHTLAALEAGELSEWRAQIIVRETATLTGEQRSLVDAEVVGDPTQPVAGLGDRELARRVRAVAYRIDAASVMARAAKAEADRRVTLRPAPDTMAYLTALLPVAQAVAAHAALTAAADTARAAGDDRGKGQVMADTLVERVTGQDTADAVPVEIQLVMTDEALLADDDTPAHVTGYGPVPAQWVRDLLTIRTPSPGHGRRRSPGSERTCGCAGSSPTRSPGPSSRWTRSAAPSTAACAATSSPATPAPAAPPGATPPPATSTTSTTTPHGGPTTDTNGQSLCVRCNHTKQLPGFTATTITGPQPGAPHTVQTTTPTGHTYTSHAPPLLPARPPDPSPPDLSALDLSPLERALTLALAA